MSGIKRKFHSMQAFKFDGYSELKYSCVGVNCQGYKASMLTLNIDLCVC